MIVQEKTRDVEVSSSLTSNIFKIQTSAKAFKILSDSLYTNKVRAVVRELSTNAIDACIEAGKEVHVEVHLPTAFEPYFSVTDYGIGMSDEQVLDLYTTYFSSSKTNTNDQIGALGLGSKSPFAYTQSFTIDTCQNGSKRAYSCFMNNAGCAEIVMLNEMEGDYPNGTTIKLSVRENDYDQFVDEAAYIYSGFDYQPVITGATANYEELRETSAPKILFQGNGWRMESSDHILVARMGGIRYPVDLDDWDFKSATKGLVIDFPIGALEITPSREALSLDDVTIQNIRDKVTEVQFELPNALTERLAEQTTPWDKMMFAYSIRSICSRNNISYNSGNQEFSISSINKYMDDLYLIDGDRLIKTFLRSFSYSGPSRYERDTTKRVNYRGEEMLFVVCGADVLDKASTEARIKKYVRALPNEPRRFCIIDEEEAKLVHGANIITWEAVKAATVVKSTRTKTIVDSHIYVQHKGKSYAVNLATMEGLRGLPTVSVRVVKGKSSYYDIAADGSLKKIEDSNLWDRRRVLDYYNSATVAIPSSTYTAYKATILATKKLTPEPKLLATLIRKFVKERKSSAIDEIRGASEYVSEFPFVLKNLEFFKNQTYTANSEFGKLVSILEKAAVLAEKEKSLVTITRACIYVADSLKLNITLPSTAEDEEAGFAEVTKIVKKYPLLAQYKSLTGDDYVLTDKLTVREAYYSWDRENNLGSILEPVAQYIHLIDNL